MNKAAQLPSFAEDIATRFDAVSPQRHGTWSWQPFASFAFAHNYASVPIVLAELHPVASALPILFEPVEFAQGPEGGLQPVALLHLADEAGRVISPEGAWQATYVPGALRTHPFACDLRPDRGAPMLHLDPESRCLSQIPGHLSSGQKRLFDVNGAPTASFRAVQAFFDSFQTSLRATRRATQALSQAGLLKPARLPDLPRTGYFSVNRDALSRLPGDVLADLVRSEALDLAMAQILSLQKITHMKQIAVNAAKANAVPPPAAQQERAAPLAGNPFMDAMARAYETDRDEIFFKT